MYFGKVFRFYFEIKYQFAISKNWRYGWHFSVPQKSTYDRSIRFRSCSNNDVVRVRKGKTK